MFMGNVFQLDSVHALMADWSLAQGIKKSDLGIKLLNFVPVQVLYTLMKQPVFHCFFHSNELYFIRE